MRRSAARIPIARIGIAPRLSPGALSPQKFLFVQVGDVTGTYESLTSVENPALLCRVMGKVARVLRPWPNQAHLESRPVGANPSRSLTK